MVDKDEHRPRHGESFEEFSNRITEKVEADGEYPDEQTAILKAENYLDSLGSLYGKSKSHEDSDTDLVTGIIFDIVKDDFVDNAASLDTTEIDIESYLQTRWNIIKVLQRFSNNSRIQTETLRTHMQRLDKVLEDIPVRSAWKEPVASAISDLQERVDDVLSFKEFPPRWEDDFTSGKYYTVINENTDLFETDWRQQRLKDGKNPVLSDQSYQEKLKAIAAKMDSRNTQVTSEQVHYLDNLISTLENNVGTTVSEDEALYIAFTDSLKILRRKIIERNIQTEAFLPPKTDDLKGNAYGEFQMFLGEHHREISEAAAIAAILDITEDQKLQESNLESLRRIARNFEEEQKEYIKLKDDAEAGVLDADLLIELRPIISKIGEYIGWIQALEREVEARLKKTGEEEIGNFEIENASPQRLFDHAKNVLWPNLFSSKEVSTGSSNKDFNTPYSQIVNKLRGEGQLWQRRAEYLEDMRNMWDVIVKASTGGMTMNYKDLNEYAGSSSYVFGAQHFMRLLYGHDYSVDRVALAAGNIQPDLHEKDPESTEVVDSKEVLRVKYTQQILRCYWTIISSEDRSYLGDTSKNPYYVTGAYTTGRKDNLQKEIDTLWKEFYLGKDENDELDELQQESKTVAGFLMTFLDYRSVKGLLHYGAGHSYSDEIVNSIGQSAQIFNPVLRRLYLNAGKSGEKKKDAAGFISMGIGGVAGMTDEFEDLLLRSKKEGGKYKYLPEKATNIRFTKHMSKVWHQWWALHLDEVTPDGSDESIVYKPKSDFIFDGLWAMFPPTDIYGNSNYSTDMRDMVLASLKPEYEDVAGRNLELTGLLSAMFNIKQFIETCEKGSDISGAAHTENDSDIENMERDAESIGGSIRSMANSFSPSKALPTTDFRRLANYLYNYCRNSAIAFGEAYHKLPGYEKNYATFIKEMRSALKNANTLSQSISGVPEAFKRKYGLPVDKKVSMAEYVLALLPNADVSTLFGGFFYVDGKRNIDDEMHELILKSVRYSEKRHDKNKTLLHHEQGLVTDGRYFIEHQLEVSAMGVRQLIERDVSPELSHHFTIPDYNEELGLAGTAKIVNDDRSEDDLYRGVKMPGLVGSKENADESK